MNKELCFVTDADVAHYTTSLYAMVKFTVAGYPITDGRFESTWHALGYAETCNSRVSTFIIKGSNTEYINHQIAHVLEMARGLLNLHPQWKASFQLVSEKMDFYGCPTERILLKEVVVK
jgi:hypothetical protein